MALSSCSVELPQMPCWNGICSAAVVHFSAVIDFVQAGDQTTEILVQPIGSESFLWKGYTPQTIQVSDQSVFINVQRCDISEDLVSYLFYHYR